MLKSETEATKKTTRKKTESAAAPRSRKTAAPKAAAPRTAVPDLAVPEPTYEEIAARAYALWESGGHRHGSSDQDWILAEQQLRAERAAALVRPRPGSRRSKSDA
jgi:hypothetical protein